MKIKDILIKVIPVVLIILFFSIVTLFIENSYEKDVIQENLIWIGPIFFYVTLAAILVTLFLGRKQIKKAFGDMDKKTLSILIIIFLAGMSMRVFMAPHTHRLYYDEDIYLNIGQNIAREGRAILCNYGNQEECFEGIYNKQPNGYPFLMSFIFLFGNGENLAHYFTSILSSLIIPVVFFIGYILFDKKVGIFSSLIFALIPISILWAPTTTAGSVSILFMGMSFLLFLIYFKTKKDIVLLSAFLTLVYSVQIRPEGIIFIGIIAMSFILLNNKFIEDFGRKRFLIFLTLFCFLLVPHSLHTLTVRSESWGASGNKLGLEYVEKNLEVNGMFFLNNTRFPAIFTLISIAGIFPFISNWKKKSILITWFVSFFILYLLFYAGSFDYGVDVRFSLNLYIPLALLGGCGSLLLFNLIKKFFKKEWTPTVSVILIIVIVFIPFYSFSTNVGEKAWDARAPHDFIVGEMKTMDDDCWIFTHVPSIVLVNGKNSLQAWYAQNNKVREEIMKEECVFFYEEYWCNSEPYKSGACKYFYDNFDMEIYSNMSERNKNYTIYRITGMSR